jgi:glucose-1-phosphate thymidylyltransferase
VILTGGRGTRLQPLTPAIPKALIPLLNRPLIDYSLDQLASAGIDDIVIVVSGAHEGVAEAARRLAPPGVTVSVAEQAAPLGIGDAVTSVGAALDGRSVVVLAVDTHISGEIRSAVDAFDAAAADAGLILHPTDRPQEMGIATLEGDRIVDLVEKPEQPRSDLAAVGIWMLGPATVERLRTNPFIRPSDGETDLTGTIGEMVTEGADVRGWRLDGEWLDTGTLSSLLATQAHYLASDNSIPSLARNTITGPVLIGVGTTIENCEIGPNVVIGDHAVVRSTRLRDALVVARGFLDGGDHAHVVVTASGEIGPA